MKPDQGFALRLPHGAKGASQDVVKALKLLDADRFPKVNSINKLFVGLINRGLSDLYYELSDELEAISHEELRGYSEMDSHFKSNPGSVDCRLSDFDPETPAWYVLAGLKRSDSENPGLTRSEAARLYADELERVDALDAAIKALRGYLPDEFIDDHNIRLRRKTQENQTLNECPFD